MEEVERERGRHGRERTRSPSARDRRQHDYEHEDQGDVGVGDVATDPDQDTGHEDREQRAERHAERSIESGFFAHAPR